jgi:hypothetical protein
MGWLCRLTRTAPGWPLMPEDLITRAETLLTGTTPGPWIVNREGWASISSGSDSVIHAYVDYADYAPDGCENDCQADVACSIEDREFIAAARTLVPELLAEVKRLRERLDGLHEEWGLRYDSTPFDVVFGREANPDGTVTRVAPMPNEVYARQALASPAPIGAKNKVVVCRRVSGWEACDV